MAGRLDGKTAIVTGGSRGIGEAIALAMVREGAKVIITSRKQEGVDAAAERINAEVPDSATPKVCHNGSTESIDALYEWIDAEGLSVDILVNNAAANPYLGPMVGASWGAWDKTFEVNLKGPFHFCRHFAQRCMADSRKGAIVNVTSVFGMTAAPFQGVYAMTKAAIISLTRTLAAEWGQAGIRINAVAPGLVDTHFASAIVQNDAFLRVFTERSAMKRYAQPEEITGVVIYLASDDAGFTTGAVFPVDGGYTSA